jgi:hypothetical protein
VLLKIVYQLVRRVLSLFVLLSAGNRVTAVDLVFYTRTRQDKFVGCVMAMPSGMWVPKTCVTWPDAPLIAGARPGSPAKGVG